MLRKETFGPAAVHIFNIFVRLKYRADFTDIASSLLEGLAHDHSDILI